MRSVRGIVQTRTVTPDRPTVAGGSPILKTLILDEFVTATDYARKYAIRQLRQPVEPKLTIQRPRAPHYGPPVQQALQLAWTARQPNLR